MYEDLTNPTPSRETLKNTIKEFRELLKESRKHIKQQQDQYDDLKNDYDEVKQDAGRFARHIKDINDRIQDEGLEQIFQDIPIPD